MKRGDIYWAELGPPAGRRPVLLITRSRAIAERSRVTVAPITTTVRGIRSEIALGRPDGMKRACVASCDDLATITKTSLLPKPIGRVRATRMAELDRALRYALEIRS